MNYKIILYALFIMVSAIAVSGINFNGFIKKDKVIEARILSVILSIVLGYILTNFVIDFINLEYIL